jgi:hypothetical protein
MQKLDRFKYQYRKTFIEFEKLLKNKYNKNIDKISDFNFNPDHFVVSFPSYEEKEKIFFEEYLIHKKYIKISFAFDSGHRIKEIIINYDL